MMSFLQRLWWKMVALVSPRSWLARRVRARVDQLLKEVAGEATDKFLELLLYGMEFAFLLLPGYRRNLRDFRGNYRIRTADGQVGLTALFQDGRMRVREDAVPLPNVTVTFQTPKDLRDFLFSKDQDVLQSLLTNAVEVDGNISYIYKFGYMARALTRRLGLQ